MARLVAIVVEAEQALEVASVVVVLEATEVAWEGRVAMGAMTVDRSHGTCSRNDQFANRRSRCPSEHTCWGLGWRPHCIVANPSDLCLSAPAAVQRTPMVHSSDHTDDKRRLGSDCIAPREELMVLAE